MTSEALAMVETHEPPRAGDARAFSASLVTVGQPNSRPAEAIRALRTHLMAQHFQQGRKALAICGPSGAVGCTFTAANLAVSLSQIGMSTLLIDADLRHPTIDAILPLGVEVEGLHQYLANVDIGVADCIETDVLPYLSVMYSGGAAPNPQELLAGDRFSALMEFCLREFDATIIDTPPANSCSDARRVATVAGYGLIVARRDKSYVDDVKTLTSQIQADHARVVGTVLNEA